MRARNSHVPLRLGGGGGGGGPDAGRAGGGTGLSRLRVTVTFIYISAGKDRLTHRVTAHTSRQPERAETRTLGRDAAHRAPTHSISLESAQGPLFYGPHSRPLHPPPVAAPKLSSQSATDSFPSTPCLASRFATRPDDFASATNESRNATAASQAAASPRGVPIAWDRAGVVCHLMQYQCIGRFR